MGRFNSYYGLKYQCLPEITRTADVNCAITIITTTQRLAYIYALKIEVSYVIV